MKVQQILEGFLNPPLELVSETICQEVKPLKLETVNWEQFPYLPEVNCRIAYNENELFLHYQVDEQSVKAEITESNGRVWTDSCVEFFLSPEGNTAYYNIEMNCIGTILFGFREKGESSIHATDEQISDIRIITSLGNRPFAERKQPTKWEITVAIPWKVFFNHELTFVKGSKMRGNFYKCGDGLSVPHFVSWTKINTPNPSFHAPECFGGLEFD